MIGTALEVVKTTTADSDVGLLAGIGQRFLSFCDRFGSHFRSRTRTVETPVKHYLRGLLQAETKNRERMEEVVPEADHQALQHMLSEVGLGGTGRAGPSGAGCQSALGRSPR